MQSPAFYPHAHASMRAMPRVRSPIFMTRRFAPTGLRLSQFAILAAIRQRHGATMQEIATELGLDPSTMTRTLRPLEDQKLVHAQPGDDKRAKTLELTVGGRETLQRSLELWRNVQDALRRKIGGEVFERLNADLVAVVRALRSNDET
jgi:DNA-binding MarR family transcriptional regulator